MSSRYVLDASAIIALLRDQPGAQMVEDLLVADDTELFLSVVSLGEVFYIVQRSFGEQAAAGVEERVLDTPKIKVIEASWTRAKAAAKIKAGGGLPFADCFAAALAAEMGATLVTSDADFKRLEADGQVKITRLA